MKKYKNEIDKKYQTPDAFKKIYLYIKYLARMLAWRMMDYIRKPRNKLQINPNFKLEANFLDVWETEGYLHLSGVFESSFIDEINKSINKSRLELSAKSSQKAENSGRIANVHAINRPVFKFLMDPFLQGVLRRLLSGNPILWGSLSFNVGTQQSAHTDSPWFFVRPYGSMIGVWIALEDINPDSGPLFYIPKSHKTVLEVEEVLIKYPELHAEVSKFRSKNCSASSRKYWDLSKKVADIYSKEFEKYEDKKIVCPKKGDVFIWHQWLVHGGSPVADNMITRKSIVSHWISDRSKAYDQHNFFLNYGRFEDKYSQKLSINKTKDGLFLRQYKSQILNWN